MRGPECGTDHYMIRCRLKVSIHQPRQRTAPCQNKKLDVCKLKEPMTRNNLNSTFSETYLSSPNSNASEKWQNFQSALYRASKEVLGHPKRKNQDWFDDSDPSIFELLREKRKAHLACLSKPSCQRARSTFSKVKAELQRKLRDMEDSWWDQKAEEIQRLADIGDTRGYYQALKTIYHQDGTKSSPLLATDGTTLLTEQSDIIARWKTHFDQLLNQRSNADTTVLDRIPQRPILTCADEPLLMDEVRKAVHSLASNKSPGMDGIQAEIYKKGGEQVIQALYDVLSSVWNEKLVPQEFKDAAVIPIFKKKGNRQECGNYRGISLLSVAGKVLGKIILKRLQPILDAILPESQCGFRSSRSTIDMVFTLRQLQEKAIEQNRHLYMVFIDFTKAFDTVNRECLWSLLHRYGCPEGIISLISQLHTGMTAQVSLNGTLSEQFPVNQGVKQGCVLAPSLFSIYLSAVLELCPQHGGVYLRTRTDGKLYNASRLKAKTLTRTVCARELLYADDSAMVSHSETELQGMLDAFHSAAQSLGLTINTKKTEVMLQPPRYSDYADPKLLLDGKLLQAVDNFTYLGSTVSSDNSLDKEVERRISAATAAYGKLQSKVWKRHGIRLATKCKVYRAVVLTCLLYSSETYILYRRHIKRLQRTQMHQLRHLLKIHWQDHISNADVRRRAGMPSVEALLTQNQLRWIGHVVRMEDTRLPKLVFYSELSEGSRNRGRPKLRLKDCVKRHLKACNVQVDSWEQTAKDRPRWKAVLKRCTSTIDDRLAEESAECSRKRALRNDNRFAPPAPTPPYSCRYCSRTCSHRIGLYAHERHCRSRPTP